jgi:hypothetical protein
MNTGRIVVYVAILVMYTMSTVHSAAAWVVAKTFFDMNDQSSEALELLSNPLVELSLMATGIALPVNTLLADCILVSLPTIIKATILDYA